jgi:hypothetical protein
MKYLFFAILLIMLGCNSNDVDNNHLRSSDSETRKAIDSSAIINENSKLPTDSMGTTVNH